MVKLFLVCGLLLFSALLVYGQQQCQYDYQCGNIPYALCKGGVNDCSSTINGLAVDHTSNTLYYAQLCRDIYGNNNITFKKVSANGGAPSVILSQAPPYYQPSINQVYEIYNNELYIYSYNLMTLDVNSKQLNHLALPNNQFFSSAGGLDFEFNARQSYVCEGRYVGDEIYYDIFKVNGILGQDSSAQGQVLYKGLDTMCTAVRVSQNTDALYIATVSSSSTSPTSYFFKASKTCLNCTQAPQLLFARVNETVSDFVVVNDELYFTSDKGVFSSDLSGQHVATISTTSSSAIQYSNNRIYWNNGLAIMSSNLDGTNQKQVNQDSGLCGCSLGFTGSNCATCNGQVQWWFGSPYCIKILADGFPESCHNNYECGKQPFASCGFGLPAGHCYCNYGFQGPNCDQCTNSSLSLTWKNGYPTCQ